MASAERLRILTYNVHRCVGRDNRLAPQRIADAIAELRPDVVALQELDVNRLRTKRADQARLIAEALHMHWFFHPALRDQDEHYGDALLSRYPMRLIKAGVLPTLPDCPHLETRGALWIAVDWADQEVQILTTHLGLKPREQLVQVEALLGADWLTHPECRPPLVLCGDLNAIPGTRPYRRLRGLLNDPFPWHTWPPGTFPTAYPLLRIDHVLLSSSWIVHSVDVPRTRLTRIASDHLPLLVEASLS